MNKKLTFISILFILNQVSFAQQIGKLSGLSCKIEEKKFTDSIKQTFKLDSLNKTAILIKRTLTENDKLYIKKAEPFTSSSLVGRNFVNAKILKKIFSSNHPSLSKYKIIKTGPVDPKPSRWAETIGEYNRIDKQIENAVKNNSTIVYEEWSTHLKGASGDQRSLGVTEYPYPIVSYETGDAEGLTSISAEVEYSNLIIEYKPISKNIDPRLKGETVTLRINTNTGELESLSFSNGKVTRSAGHFIRTHLSEGCKMYSSNSVESEILNSLGDSVQLPKSVQDDNRSFIKPDLQPTAVDKTRAVVPHIIEQ